MGEVSYKYNIDLQEKIRMKLAMLHLADQLIDLSIPPSNRLEKLKGTRKFQYSIRINKQYRICFEWWNGDCHNVEIVDYH